MIGKIFPRILNKSSEKTSIKASEFSDALNVLVTGDDAGEANIISKADGNISSVISGSDEEKFKITASDGSVIQESVIGKYEDEIRNRIYYFAYGEGASTGYSSIYLLQKMGPQDYQFDLVLREQNGDGALLNFGFEDFVPANIIQTPTLDKKFFRDATASGSQGDTTSDFDFDGEGDVEAFTGLQFQSIEIVEETNVLVDIADSGSQDTAVAEGTVTLFNFGTAQGEVSLAGSITTTISGVTISFASNTVIVPAGAFVYVPFEISLNIQLVPGGVDQEIDFSITATEINPGVSMQGSLPTSLTDTTLFTYPASGLPEVLEITVPDIATPDDIAVNTPGPGSETAGSLAFFGNVFNETQYATVIGPFTIKLKDWDFFGEGSGNAYLNGMRVSITLPDNSEQGNDGFWEIVNATEEAVILDNENDYEYPFSLDYVLPAGPAAALGWDDENNELTLGAFYIRKSFDTVDWFPETYSEQEVYVTVQADVRKLNAQDETYIAHAVKNINPDSASNYLHTVYAGGNVVDEPTPANIQVTNVSWAENQELFPLQPHVDDGSSTQNGSNFTVTVTVSNLGESGGYYYPTVDWAENAWSQLEDFSNLPSAFTSLTDFTGNINLFDVWKGGYELSSVAYNNYVGPVYSREYINNPGIVANIGPGGTYGNFVGLDSTLTPIGPIQLWSPIGGGTSQEISFTFSNEAADFQFGDVYISVFDSEGDTDISGTYEGTSGPYSFYGTPQSALPAGTDFPNKENFKLQVYALNGNTPGQPEDPNDLSSYVSVWDDTLAITVGDDYLGNLQVATSKTPALSNPAHPLIEDILYQEGQGPVATLSQLLDSYPNNGRIEVGPLEGQRIFYPGVYNPTMLAGSGYPTFYSLQASSSGAGVTINGTPTAQTEGFWLGGVSGEFGAPSGSNPVDLVFTNTTTQNNAGNVSLSIRLEPLQRWWVAGENMLGANTPPQGLGQQIIERTREWSGEGYDVNKHQATQLVAGPDMIYDVTATGLGSIGFGIVFTNPIPQEVIDQQPPGATIVPESVPMPDGTTRNFFTQNSNGEPSFQFPNFSAADNYNFGNNIPGLNYHGTFRGNEISIPPRHTVIGRIVYKFQGLGNSNPYEGLEDLCDAREGVDYSNPAAAWGMPCIVRARWTGGVQNEVPTFANIGVAVGVTSFSQYNNMI